MASKHGIRPGHAATNVRLEKFPKGGRILTCLEPALHKMGQVMDRYVNFVLERYSQQDTPYMYCERATLSQFAGGVWLSDPANLVLEEYISDKQCDAGKYRGRGDIWFVADGVRCYGEAKQGWITLGRPRPSGWKNKIEVLRAECEAAHRSSEVDRAAGSVQLALGLLFLPVAITDDFLAEFDDRLEALHDQIRTDVGSLVADGRYEVLWAHYRRSDLLDPQRCYDGALGKASQPALETLICVKRPTSPAPV